jgi:Cu+-exporting ATPase
MVEYDDAKVTPKSLEEAVKKTGDMYSVKDMKTVESFTADTME